MYSKYKLRNMIMYDFIIMAKILVTSPVVINVPTREPLAVETKSSFVQLVGEFK